MNSNCNYHRPKEDNGCCDRGRGPFKFHEVYWGFNDDIYESIYGIEDIDPCCKTKQSNQKQPDSEGNSGGSRPPCCSCGQSTPQPSSMRGSFSGGNSGAQVGCCSCGNNNGMPGTGSGKEGCCPTQRAFNPREIYVGFNENVYNSTDCRCC